MKNSLLNLLDFLYLLVAYPLTLIANAIIALIYYNRRH